MALDEAAQQWPYAYECPRPLVASESGSRWGPSFVLEGPWWILAYYDFYALYRVAIKKSINKPGTVLCSLG